VADIDVVRGRSSNWIWWVVALIVAAIVVMMLMRGGNADANSTTPGRSSSYATAAVPAA
jgi:bacteriorhodopsin